MRLYGMYYTCKMYLETVQNMEIGSKVITAGPVKYIEGWNEKSIILTINEQIQNIAQKKDTLCRRMYN